MTHTPRHQWTPHQLAMLQAQYPHQRTTDLAAELGIDIKRVYAKANRMGLRKSDAFLATDASGRILKGGKLSQDTQFKPGQKTWNQGLSYQPGGRCADTQFKPGSKPYTTMPLGSYRIITNRGRKYQQLERKTAEVSGPNHKRWTPVARLVWEAAHGPVPKGCIVVFKPGQRTVELEQITLDRLECITRAQNADRNHPNRSNPEVAPLIHLKGAITRQVNRIARLSEQGATAP